MLGALGALKLGYFGLGKETWDRFILYKHGYVTLFKERSSMVKLV